MAYPSMTADELLKYLLALDDPRLAALKAALLTCAPVFLDISAGNGTPLLQIYTIKKGIAKEGGSSTEGYEDLLANLPGAQNREVSVLQVNTESKAFLVFTNEETKRVLGVLSGDRKS